ncbi:MAG: hypothetical protein ACXWLC_07750 [Rhizomicrobium sp.]
MLDPLIRRYLSPLLTAPAARVAALGVSADALTVASFVIGLAALPAIGRRAYLVGLGLMALSRLIVLAGSAVARLKPPTPFGTYLDFVLDVVWTASVPFAFALGQPDRALAAMFLMLGLVARAAALSAEAKLGRGVAGTALQFGGTLVGKTEIFVAFALACVFADWFSIIAYVLGLVCFVMAGFRVAHAGLQRT